MSDARLLAYVCEGDNHLRHVSQIIGSSDWKIDSTPLSLREALGKCLEGTVTGLIIEDTHQLPVTIQLMRELRNPLLYLVPIIVLLDKDRRDDADILTSHYGFDVVTKPLSRVMMVQAFTSFVRKIQSDTGRRLAIVLREFNSSDFARRQILLDSLAGDPVVVHRAKCAKAADMMAGEKPGDAARHAAIKAAEAELLRHAKLYPRHVSAFILLGGLYAEWAMPVVAKRIYQAASVVAPRFSNCHAALAQMHLLLGEMEEAIASLRRLLQVGFMPEETSFALAKIFFSIGRVDDANRILQGQAGRFNTLHAAWVEAK